MPPLFRNVALLSSAALLTAALASCSSAGTGEAPPDSGRGDDAAVASDSPVNVVDSTAPDAAVGDDADAAAPDSSSLDSGASDSMMVDSTAGDSATGDSAPGDSSLDGTMPGTGDAPTDAPPEAAAQQDGGTPCPADGGIPDGIPAELRCAGLYSDWATKTVATDVMQYTPGVELWSDSAVKTRWLWLPPGTKIDTSNLDDWTFPVGTKVFKQFVVGGKLIETRLLWKQPGNADYMKWTYVVYRWSADEKSTFNLSAGETNVNGGTYEVPATWMCPQCHAGRNDNVLGLDLIGTGISTAKGLTLATLVTKGLLTQPPPVTKVVIPEDATKKAAPALQWLHMNCGVSCHNPDMNSVAGYTGLNLKLLSAQLYPEAGAAKVATLDSYTTAVNVMSNLRPNGMQYNRIAPGDSANSLITLMAGVRMPNNGQFTQMPPIVSHMVDAPDVQLVKDWIDALKP